jgi:hypothetical protein
MSGNNTSTISITRTSQVANHFRSIAIYLDGRQVGSVKNGKTIQVSVSPGTHEFVAGIAWCKSKPLRLRIGADQAAELTCGSYASGWKLLLTPILIFTPQAYLYLRPIGGST